MTDNSLKDTKRASTDEALFSVAEDLLSEIRSLRSRLEPFLEPSLEGQCKDDCVEEPIVSSLEDYMKRLIGALSGGREVILDIEQRLWIPVSLLKGEKC